ncbi:MAG: peroxiredoxin [Ignavibacteriae bacterium]|nr:peroxiredoxin [Ignavibacteria bacterium]MBI3365786.1 peroxiredoxin [Ignavibacteriota bacterium]
MKSSMILLFLPLLLLAQENSAPSLKVGDPAPNFSLPYATQDSVAEDKLTLASLFGKRNIILAFYPADWSGGCTKEMCTMRDNFSELSKLNAEVLGISGDYEYSHHEWAKALKLPFKLLADHVHAVARTYGSYNNDYGMNKRTVYVIDKSGEIAYIDLEYKARDLASFNKLQDAIKKLQ